MNKIQYAKYLGNIQNLEIDVANESLADEFYAYFQCFMPNGNNLDKVFEPLENGKQLLDRLLPIYEITKDNTEQQLNEGLSSGYFCPISIPNHDLLEDLGKEYLEDLKLFAQFYNDNELLQLLNSVKEVVVLDNEPELENDYLNSFLYDTISEWGLENENDNDLISVLSEGYYSINCDYYLSYYFQYPHFKDKPTNDFLKSYFEIWKNGYYCKFDENKLIVYKR